MEVLCPQTSLISSFSLLQNCYFLNFNHWKYGFYVYVGKSMLLNEVVYLRCLLRIYMHQHFLNHDFISQKKLQRLGTAFQRPLPNFILPLHPINHKLICPWMWTIEHIPRTMLFVSNICFNKHPNEWFSSLIFQNISREEHRAPSPNPFSRFRSGFALSSGSALNSWALRTPTLASHSIIGRFAASIRASPSTFNLRNWFDPQKIFLYPPVLVCALFGEFLDRLLIINYTDSL